MISMFLDPNNKSGHVFQLLQPKWNYMCRESRAANCALLDLFIWLDMVGYNFTKKDGLLSGNFFAERILIDFCIGWCKRLDRSFLSKEVWFLLGTSSASICCLTSIADHMFVNFARFWARSSSAFRFQVRVCADPSCITHVPLLLITVKFIILWIVLTCFDYLGGFEH